MPNYVRNILRIDGENIEAVFDFSTSTKLFQNLKIARTGIVGALKIGERNGMR